MKIVAFIETRQTDPIRKMLEHSGLWHDPPSRAPPPGAPSPSGPSQPSRQVPTPNSGGARREQLDQPNLPWDA